ncbi:hypothetical protein T4C_8486 [Trichinella pseudospiralis]|uniref:Uncharacterized protein n=1 Tax=Trichinella pseudospiralis TaxID=6337 RepID=A0A0V1K1L7_TRIPS|nr:hypothetical protein T4D_16134 [Trichinella pseudospiralis]KRZ41143.1 hypothetical protein T4C_8486 [Trichinella pseudospiralis]
MSFTKWKTCPEWDLKYLKHVNNGETKMSVNIGDKGRILELDAVKAYAYRAEDVAETLLFCSTWKRGI